MNSEHSLNTLRYADRVKELKGDSNIENDGYEYSGENVENNSEIDDQEPFEDSDLLDQEFPPENMQLVEQIKSPEQIEEIQVKQKTSILDKLNQTIRGSSKKAELYSNNEDHLKTPTSKGLEPRGMTMSIDQPDEPVDVMLLLDELVKLHRQHIRENTESGKLESKLLVNLTMKMGRNVTDKNANVTFDSYVRELNEIMERKAQGLDEIRQKIGQILNTH